MIRYSLRYHLLELLLLLLVAVVAATATTWAMIPLRCDVGSGDDLLCARGFETRELAYGQSYRWSDGNAYITVPFAGYGSPLLVHLTMRSGRPAGSRPVTTLIALNGHHLFTTHIVATNRHYRLLAPTSLTNGVGDTACIQLYSTTWKPSPISRSFGIIVQDVHISATIPVWYTSFLPQRLPGIWLIAVWLALLLSIHVLLTVSPSAGDGISRTVAKNAQATVGLKQCVFVIARSSVLSMLCVTALFASNSIVLLVPCVVFLALYSLAWRRYATPHTAHFTRRAVAFALLAALPYGILLAHSDTTLLVKIALLLMSGGAALVGALVWERQHTPRIADVMLALVGSTLLMRLAFVCVRLALGATWLDGDVELFYAYGMALRETGLPDVEYPTGALVPWAAMTWLSGDSRELFALMLALLNSLCEAASVALLVLLVMGVRRDENSTFGKHHQHQYVPLALVAWYVFSPLLEPFVFGKYDPLPAMFALSAVTFFAMARPSAAGAAAGIGATIKWTPLLTMPFFALHFIRQRRWHALALLITAHVGAVALVSVPFAINDWHTFILPYTIQGGRAMNGESVWYVVAMLLDPTMAARVGAPWGGITGGVIPVGMMVGVQLALLTLTGMMALVRPLSWQRTLALAALAPALFLILNRVFSPQYVLPISSALVAAWLCVKPTRRQTVGILVLLVIAQIGNLLVWPLFVPHGWIIASAMLFSSLLVLSVWLSTR